MNDFNYKIIEHIATLSEFGNCTKEVNLISFNGASPKYDIRTWATSEDGKKLYKGVTLSEDEMEKLVASYTAKQGKN